MRRTTSCIEAGVISAVLLTYVDPGTLTPLTPSCWSWVTEGALKRSAHTMSLASRRSA
jgi:hypothetical protein